MSQKNSPEKVTTRTASPRTGKHEKKSNTSKKGSNKSIFKHQRPDTGVDVVWADCMNHGYRIEKSLGEGAYAKVKLAEVMQSKLARNQHLADLAEGTDILNVAIKVVENKRVPREFRVKFLPRELNNHVPLSPHPNVVRVYEQFATTERVYVVMEYCSKGDLLDLINQRISDSFKGVGEDMARRLFQQTCLGVSHIHANRISHRDLKCENILINEEGNAKITDFGFSCKFHEKSKFLKTSCGSYAYTAPEVIQSKPYDGFRSDTWSLGVILFAMLNGRLPFNDAQILDMEEDMKMQRLRFERTVSFESMVLVRKILQYNPTQRPTLNEILNDPWLTVKRPIPRQINKPIHNEKPPVRKGSAETERRCEYHCSGSPAKSALPERGCDATVTLNHDKLETVTLKSFRNKNKNIWSSGPASGPVKNRPNTWPRAEKDSASTAQTKRNTPPYRYPANRHTYSSAIKAKGTKLGGEVEMSTRSPSGKTIRLSKWFVDQYLHSYPGEGVKGLLNKSRPGSTGGSSKTPVKLPSELTYVNRGTSPILNQSKVVQTGEVAPDSANKGTLHTPREGIVDKAATGDVQRADMTKSARWSNSKIRTRSTAADPVRTISANSPKPQTPKSAVRDTSPTRGRTPVASTSADMSNCYFANRSTSPMERVKYFRNRVQQLYGDKLSKDGDQLPPLMVQSLAPRRDQGPSSKSPSYTRASPVGPAPQLVTSPTGRRSQSPTPQIMGENTRGHNSNTRKWFLQSTPMKPVQRVIVH